MSNPAEKNFMCLLEFIWFKQRICLEAISQQTKKNVSQNDSLQGFFMHLEMRRESKKDYTTVGESKVRIGLQGS